MWLLNFMVASGVLACSVLTAATSVSAPLPSNPGQSTANPAAAFPAFLLNFDENGNATVAVDGGTATPLTGTLISDPSNPCPSCALVLAYPLPEPVVTGTVEILDPGGAISDALRFTDAAGIISGAATGAGPIMIYYSDTVPDPGSQSQLADTGFPSNLTAGNFAVGPTETVGPGGASFDYQSGGVPYPLDNEYVGISDVAAVAVPEPASFALFGSVIAAMGLMIRWRRGQT